jgi:hypothetical protein
LAVRAEQIDLDLDPDFNMHYVSAMVLSPNSLTKPAGGSD